MPMPASTKRLQPPGAPIAEAHSALELYRLVTMLFEPMMGPPRAHRHTLPSIGMDSGREDGGST